MLQSSVDMSLETDDLFHNPEPEKARPIPVYVGALGNS